MKDDGGEEQSQTQKPPAAMFCEFFPLAPPPPLHPTPFLLPAKFFEESCFIPPTTPPSLSPLSPSLNLAQHHFSLGVHLTARAFVADSRGEPPEAVATPNTLSEFMPLFHFFFWLLFFLKGRWGFKTWARVAPPAGICFLGNFKFRRDCFGCHLFSLGIFIALWNEQQTNMKTPITTQFLLSNK